MSMTAVEILLQEITQAADEAKKALENNPLGAAYCVDQIRLKAICAEQLLRPRTPYASVPEQPVSSNFSARRDR